MCRGHVGRKWKTGWHRWFGITIFLTAFLIAGQSPAASPTISWTDNSNNETGFNCYRLATATLPVLKVCSVAANVTTCSSSEQGQNGYCYRCKAFNVFGESGDSNTACWTLPNPPQSVTITAP